MTDFGDGREERLDALEFESQLRLRKQQKKSERHWNFLPENEMVEMKRLQNGNLDPVFRTQDGTYGFFDEVWADSYGPYLTYEEAAMACRDYADYMLNPALSQVAIWKKRAEAADQKLSQVRDLSSEWKYGNEGIHLLRINTVAQIEPKCSLPPSGWECTRASGHEGPCVAIPKRPPPQDEEINEDCR